MAFQIVKKSEKSWARAGIIKTAHGEIETPAFVPVATQAGLKSVTSRQAEELGTQILMVNTYHLWARDMPDVINSFGGLHNFMRWDKPIMTDSGGFQVFSLGAGFNQEISKLMVDDGANATPTLKKGLIEIDEQGITFRSHLNGSRMRLTPAISIDIQEKLGADIIFALDECTSPIDSYEYTRESLARTHAWAKESLTAKTRNDQMLFGIVQGGKFKNLREESAQFIAGLEFDGFGIGGGFGKKDVANILKWSVPFLPEDKPRHYLGIGELDDIKKGVAHGMDTFDCVTPTRLARHGTLIVKGKKVSITNARFKHDKNPPDKDCKCPTCQQFSCAYLCHLFRAKEPLGAQLATIHNLYFYNQFFCDLREKIKNDKS